MATLQKFKLLAMQCGVAQSPTRSPSSSPLVQLRRPKTTLRMLLSRSSSRRRETPLPEEHLLRSSEKNSRDLMRRNSLKDLFVSSPPSEEISEEIHRGGNTGLVGWVSGIGSPRPGWIGGFRYRSLLRKAWRPVLLTIPEE